MRNDVYIEEVLAKCESLKKSGLWAKEPKIRPQAWLNNFEEGDKRIAAVLLDQFTFYNHELTDRLVHAAYHNLGDGRYRYFKSIGSDEVRTALTGAIFSPVEGETPNPTDSGHTVCRKVRQLLGIDQELVREPVDALEHAFSGGAVVFVDDFLGSGDQFLRHWERTYRTIYPSSFKEAYSESNFLPIYLTLIATNAGMERLKQEAGCVLISATHILDDSQRYTAVQGRSNETTKETTARIEKFLAKYAPRLAPQDDYVANSLTYTKYGYNSGGLMFAFEHSVPDLSLPIYWSNGKDASWIPLVQRA